jgi:hypothetical protein
MLSPVEARLAAFALCRNRLRQKSGWGGAGMDGRQKGGFRPVHLLLMVPFYNRALPDLAGVPFFYWYQILWVALTALVLWAVYAAERHAP